MYFGLFITLNYARYIHHLMRKINDLYFYILVAIDMDQRKQEIRSPSHTCFYHNKSKSAVLSKTLKTVYLYNFLHCILLILIIRIEIIG